ncbi:winged helix-turn-helix domain-containing protein [Algiphilus sp. W345]|uniref:Winged helix-turn-helix domain-containing protein n=1 Tax=Banduia mediterranea TaxID=3075609 RepID=A0ABU2WDU1_9GAMM|nr:winged helix-turn-helix domain-containing protein [Algiphilus sp. W345]MDT0496040.1 winged helix-turn-helix domain-containing protein [Algiphilus sp. W345]
MTDNGAYYRWRFGEVQFDEAQLELRVSGLPVDLEQKPLQVLSLLLRHAGEVVTKDELFDTVWQGRVTVDHVLATAVGKVRKALGEDGAKAIITVPRVGYRLLASVERVAVGRGHASQMDLNPGAAVPGREHFRLERQLSPSGSSEVWLARHAKTGETRVYKFSPDGSRLSSLKREATLFRVLHESLGERDDFVRIIDWNFENAPFFLECAFGGISLAEWQSTQALQGMALDERLTFFLGICDTVAAAHSVGVLHKDLKPGNILVTDHGGHWHTCLTDFGSSRLLEPGRLDELGITNLGLTLTQGIGSDSSSSGTPLYLAPELIAGKAPTVQSDVYALGVMLYQLLIGDFSRPMAPGWERDLDHDLLKEDIAQTTDGNPARRLASVSELIERIRTLDQRKGELQHIAQSEQRARLAEQALERARAKQPWVGATAIALVAGLAIALVLLSQSREARIQAELERKRAEAVVSFLTEDIIGGANPDRAGHERNPTIEELVAIAAENVEDRFSGEVAVQAAVWRAMGTAAYAVSQFRNAAQYFGMAAVKAESVFGAGDARTLIARYALAEAQSAIGTSESVHNANQILDRADRIAGQRLLEDSQLALRANLARARFHFNNHQRGAALQYLERTAELQRKLQPEAHVARFATESKITEVLLRQGKAEIAMRKAESLLDEMRRTPIRGGQELRATVGLILARSLKAQRRFAAALEAAQTALSDSLAATGAHSRTSLNIRSQLAAIYDELGDCERALALMHEVSAGSAQRMGANSRFALIERGNLGLKEYECGNEERGLAIVAEVGERLRVAFGNEDAASQAFRVFHAEVDAREGRYDRALSTLVSLQPDRLTTAMSEPEWVARLDAIRGIALVGKGQYDEANALFETAIPQLVQLNGDPEAIAVYRNAWATAREARAQ